MYVLSQCTPCHSVVTRPYILNIQPGDYWFLPACRKCSTNRHHWLRFKGGSFGFLANFFLLVLFLYLCVRMGFQGGLPIPSSLGDTAISRYRVMYGFELKCAEITAYCSPALPL